MATLVLTAVGTALGGPAGGAIGALVGQSVDRRIFKPATREGPRLTELAVQTSSYGTQIPKLFGTIRVAGTVIWATDLIETRTTSGGSKGQPSSAAYSYSANFAVLLSARAIRGIGRIWAEGKLLRGAAGDWKTTTGFRLHLGGEDQAPDPLIASADPTTPAYRGCAYAVFEGLHLADFGNRIPSMTFEVIADEGAVAAGTIAMALAGEVDADVAQMLDGYAAAGESVAGVLDSLALLSGAWWSPAGGRIAMIDRAGAAVSVVDDAMAIDGRAGARASAQRRRTRAAIETVPRTLAVAHHDPARDYQIGVQQAVRPGAGARAMRIDLPAVLTSPVARSIAERGLAMAETARTRRTFVTGIGAIALSPGQSVTIAGEAGQWRAATVAVEGMATRIELVPLTIAPLAGATDSGRVLASPDLQAGTTIVRIVEHPAWDGVLTAPRLSVLATGTQAGWRRAALLYSIDEGDSWIAAGSTAAPATVGIVEQPPGDGPSTLIDRTNDLVVRLARADMMLLDADPVRLGQGRNLALVGEEMLQFARAVPLGAGRWRLSDLRRGARGTDWASADHRVGEDFALLEPDAIVSIDVGIERVGHRVRVLATGIGDGAAPAPAAVTVSGASILPPSPVRLAVQALSGGAWRVSWTRRSRQGWGWPDGIDAPLAEEAERYEVTTTDPAGVRSTAAVDRPTIDMAAAAGSRIDVRQVGTYGSSHPATITL